MSKRKNDNTSGLITSGGYVPRPGQTKPNVIILTQTKRFGKDISDYTAAIKAAENIDYPQRAKLFDLYEDTLLDTHLTSVIEKRRAAALCSPIVFRRGGKPDKKVNDQIRSPWFRSLISDIIDAQFWGFTLCQFFKEGDWITYNLIPRKHVDPVKRIILHQQTDITGTSWDEYRDLLFIGKPNQLGLLAKTAPYVLYKRNGIGDWSQFSEVFGMPIQEYTYDTDDDDARQRAIDDATNAGSLAVFVHGKDTNLNLIEAGNKTGSVDVYERLVEMCNKEISKAILLNTLTTESSSTGTQALGTVHKKSEDKVTQSDRQFILDVLNYDMTDIFCAMGIDTAGGEFCYPERKEIDPTSKINILTQLRSSFNLPIDDDYLYEEFGIEKPVDYHKIKQQMEQERIVQDEADKAAFSLIKQTDDSIDSSEPDDTKQPQKRSFRNWLRRFFSIAPSKGGADLDW